MTDSKKPLDWQPGSVIRVSPKSKLPNSEDGNGRQAMHHQYNQHVCYLVS